MLIGGVEYDILCSPDGHPLLHAVIVAILSRRPLFLPMLIPIRVFFSRPRIAPNCAYAFEDNGIMLTHFELLLR